MKHLFIHIFLWIGLSWPLLAQIDSAQNKPTMDSVVYTKVNDVRYDEVRLLYKKQNTGGFVLHTRGLGANFRGYTILNAFQKTFYNIDFITLKHPKEFKITTYDDNANPYVYGKKNDVGVIGFSYGFEKVKHEKENLRSILISFNYSLGVSAAVLKPVYLEIAYPYVISGAYTVNEAYDENKHFQAQIYGKSTFGYGFNKLSLIPGLNAKASVQFEYSSSDEYVRALEVGARVDAFAREIPIMSKVKNSFFYVNLFVHWQFGKKFN